MRVVEYSSKWLTLVVLLAATPAWAQPGPEFGPPAIRMPGAFPGFPGGPTVPTGPGMTAPYPGDVPRRPPAASGPDRTAFAHNEVNRTILSGLGAYVPAAVVGFANAMGYIKPLATSRLGNALMTRFVPPFLGSLLLPAVIQLATTGRVEWDKLAAFAGGAAMAMLLFNPATVQATLLVTALGGLTGDVLYDVYRDWRRPAPPAGVPRAGVELLGQRMGTG